MESHNQTILQLLSELLPDFELLSPGERAAILDLSHETNIFEKSPFGHTGPG